jgi:hypothetical protein
MKRLRAVPDSGCLQELTPEKAMTTALTHAGAVVFRSSDKQTLYLVVSSSDGANWVLPKGQEQAAVRLLTFEDARAALLEGAAVVRRLEKRENEDD